MIVLDGFYFETLIVCLLATDIEDFLYHEPEKKTKKSSRKGDADHVLVSILYNSKECKITKKMNFLL